MARTLFTNVAVLDGTGAEPFAAEVLVDGNRIKQIAKGGTKAVGDDAELVDGGGATLMPGLIESHMHVTFGDTDTIEGLAAIPTEEHTLISVKNAKTMIDQGFTAGFSAAAAKPRMDVVIRNAINAGDIPGPRMTAASPELTVSGGLGDVGSWQNQDPDSFALICDGADQFRRTARMLCREGVDTLKINPSGDEFLPLARAHMTVMNEAEIAAVGEVARAYEKRYATHARSAGSVKLSLRHGCDVIYHATLCDEEALDMLEAAKDRVFVSPTLGITYATINEAAEYGLTDDVVEKMGFRRELDIAVENMKELKRRGVRVLGGGDYGFAWNKIGTNARDIEHFVNLLDYSPMDAILSMTKLGGEIMHMGHELGQVREGYLADLLLVRGNPLTDVRILQDAGNFLAIMKDGAFHKEPVQAAAQTAAAAE